MKRVFAVVLTLALCIGTAAPIQASLSPAVRRDALAAGQQLAKAIEIIMTYYLDSLTIDELYEAAAKGMTEKLHQTGYHAGMPTVTVGTTFPVQVARQNLSISDEALAAGQSLAESIKLIMAQYANYLTVNELMEATLHGMTQVLDTYSVYMNSSEYDRFIKVMSGKIPGLGVIKAEKDCGCRKVYYVCSNSIIYEMGLQPGDVFVFINWKPIRNLNLDEVIERIFHVENDLVHIVVRRDGDFRVFDVAMSELYTSSVAVKRFEYMPVAQGFGNLDQVRYMHISTIGRVTGNSVKQALKQMQQEGVRKLILDLQGNTGGYLDITVDIANLLVPEGIVLQTIDKAGQGRTHTSTLQKTPFEKIVVLVDRYTASGAEVIASALQDSGVAVVIGETTYGKGLVQSIYELGPDGALKITTKEYFRRNGGRINEVGVIPCILIEEFQIPGGPDAIMYRALQILTGR